MTLAKRFKVLALLGAMLFMASTAGAVNLTGTPTIVGNQLTVLINFDAPILFNGYGLDIFYDPAQLSFVGSTQLTSKQVIPGFFAAVAYFSNPATSGIGLGAGCTGLLGSACGTAAITPDVAPVYSNGNPVNFPAPTGNPPGLFSLVFNIIGGPPGGGLVPGEALAVGVFGSFSGIGGAQCGNCEYHLTLVHGPEPSTMALFGLGLAGVVALRKFRRQ